MSLLLVVSALTASKAVCLAPVHTQSPLSIPSLVTDYWTQPRPARSLLPVIV